MGNTPQAFLIAMIGKRKRHVDQSSSPGSKLRGNIVDLYAKGDISAQRCASLLDDAAQSQVVSCQVSHSVARARDLQRGLSKTSGWPPLYQARAPLKGKDGASTTGPIAVLLPHEVLHVLQSVGQEDCLYAREGSEKSSPLPHVLPSTPLSV